MPVTPYVHRGIMRGVRWRVSLCIVFVILPCVQMCIAQVKREAAPALSAGVESYRAYQKEAQALLEAELAMFFPNCIDLKGGGFHEGRVTGNIPPHFNGATLAFQSRMIWAAAEVAMRRPEKAQEYLGYGRHGARYLQDVMWDKNNGGFDWSMDSDGHPAPIIGAHKHAYAMALAIQALSHLYIATGDESYLKSAQEADQWLKRGYDKGQGGYFQAFTPQGERITSSGQTGQRTIKTDKVDTPYGCKSTIVQIHLLEAFIELYRASPDAELRQRIEDMYDVTCKKAMLPTGVMGQNFLPTWVPLDRGGPYGVNLETASLLLDAAKVLQIEQDPKSIGIVQKLVDTALDTAWDDQLGGFWTTREAREKQWQAQAEGARILLTLYARGGDESERYWTAFQNQWRFITRYMTDQQVHGWFPTVGATGQPTSRNMIQPIKACDQTVRSLLDIIDLMGVLAGDKPAAVRARLAATNPTTKPRPATVPVK